MIQMLDLASHLHGLAYFIITKNQQRQISFKIYWNVKTDNSNFINKIISLLKLFKLLNFNLRIWN